MLWAPAGAGQQPRGLPAPSASLLTTGDTSEPLCVPTTPGPSPRPCPSQPCVTHCPSQTPPGPVTCPRFPVFARACVCALCHAQQHLRVVFWGPSVALGRCLSSAFLTLQAAGAECSGPGESSADLSRTTPLRVGTPGSGGTRGASGGHGVGHRAPWPVPFWCPRRTPRFHLQDLEFRRLLRLQPNLPVTRAHAATWWLNGALRALQAYRCLP